VIVKRHPDVLRNTRLTRGPTPKLLGIGKRGDTYLRKLLVFAHNASKATRALNAEE